MSEENTDLDWAGVPEDMSRQILSQGQTFLASQLQTSLAADQRAMTAASIFIGFAGAILAATIAYWEVVKDSTGLVAGLIGVAGFVLASFCAFFSARPVSFYFPGSNPREWWSVKDQPLSEVMGGESENFQESIDHNAQVIDSNAKWLSAAMWVAVLTPVLAATFWILSFWCPAGSSPV